MSVGSIPTPAVAAHKQVKEVDVVNDAVDLWVEQLEGFVDRITRNSPVLVLRYDEDAVFRPWRIVDVANDGRVLYSADSRERLREVADVIAAREVGVVDVASFFVPEVFCDVCSKVVSWDTHIPGLDGGVLFCLVNEEERL